MAEFDLLAKLLAKLHKEYKELVQLILAHHGDCKLLVRHFASHWRQGHGHGGGHGGLPPRIDPTHIAMCLIRKHGGDKERALVHACSRTYVPAEVCKAILESADASEAPRADCLNSFALVVAAEGGNKDVVSLLLSWPIHAPRADCRDGQALVAAAERGHIDVVRLLLEWPVHAPRADCQNGQALLQAARGGHSAVVRLLLSRPVHAPRADWALVWAAERGHIDVVRLLLELPEHAPRADCLYGMALALTDGVHCDVWRLLKE